MRLRLALSLAAVSGLLPVVAACSSPAGTSDTTSATASSTAATASAPASPAASASAQASKPGAAGGPTAKVLPGSAIRDGQHVQVTATGFTPGRPLIAVLCADKGGSTGPADCDLERMASTAADAQGRVHVTLAVRKGPFGADRVVCGAGVTCVVSVADAAQPPQQQAAVPVVFR
jgi:neocarzinostatin family protein